MCVFTIVYAGGGEKRVLDPLELELWQLSSSAWVLGNKPMSSSRAAGLLNHRAIHLAPTLHYFLFYYIYLCVCVCVCMSVGTSMPWDICVSQKTP